MGEPDRGSARMGSVPVGGGGGRGGGSRGVRRVGGRRPQTAGQEGTHEGST